MQAQTKAHKFQRNKPGDEPVRGDPPTILTQLTQSKAQTAVVPAEKTKETKETKEELLEKERYKVLDDLVRISSKVVHYCGENGHWGARGMNPPFNSQLGGKAIDEISTRTALDVIGGKNTPFVKAVFNNGQVYYYVAYTWLKPGDIIDCSSETTIDPHKQAKWKANETLAAALWNRLDSKVTSFPSTECNPNLGRYVKEVYISKPEINEGLTSTKVIEASIIWSGNKVESVQLVCEESEDLKTKNFNYVQLHTNATRTEEESVSKKRKIVRLCPCGAEAVPSMHNFREEWTKCAQCLVGELE